jgi:hypothetical protein
VADRQSADPVSRFGNEWTAYAKLAEQLLMGSIKPWEIVCVLADDYSAPDTVDFEGELKRNVNRRLERLAASPRAPPGASGPPRSRSDAVPGPHSSSM